MDSHLGEGGGIAQGREDPFKAKAIREVQLTRNPILEAQPVLAVSHAEVQWRVIVIVHRHDDTEEPKCCTAGHSIARARLTHAS